MPFCQTRTSPPFLWDGVAACLLGVLGYLLGVPMSGNSVQFAALRRQNASPAFYDEWAFPDQT